MGPRAAVLLLLIAVAGAHQPAAQTIVNLPPFQLNVQERILDNGVTILVQERPAAGRVGARVFYRADIAGERPGTSGLTHLLEHYLFKGTHVIGTRDWEAERPLAERIEHLAREISDEKNRIRDELRQRQVFDELEAQGTSARLEALTREYEAAVAEQDRNFTDGTEFMRTYLFAGGTGFTASTGADWMKFDIDLPASRLELFMWMERDRITNPVFRQFDPEREVVIEQIRRSFNEPSGAFERMLRSTTFEAHPYGWAHWFSDLAAATREDHWEIFYKYFIPQNTIIVVVGDVKAAEVFAMAERYFGDWAPARPSPRLRTVEPVPAGQKRVESEAPAGPTFALNVRTPAIGHPDLPALQVLAEVLGGTDGLLTTRLVREAGIATASRAFAPNAKYSSFFGLRVSPHGNQDLQAVEAAVDDILRQVAAGGVTRPQLEAAVRALHFRFIQGFEEIGRSAVTIGSFAAIHRWDYLNALPGLWARTTPDDLARVVRTYFDPALRTIGVLRRGPGTSGWPGRATSASAEHPDERDARPAGTDGSGHIAGLPLWDYEPAFLGDRAPEHPSRRSSAESHSRVAGPTFSIQPSAPVTPEGPLAAAEQVWYAPPWMAVRRGSAPPPLGDDRPRDFRELRFPAPAFTPPDAAKHRVEIGGVPVFVVEEPLLPMVRVTAYVDASTIHDPVGKEGLAALTAELLDRGGAGTATGAQVAERFGRAGVTVASSVDRERTRIALTLPVAAQDEILGTLGAMLSQPRFEAEAFERARSNAALRAERRHDSPAAALEAEFLRAVYGDGHPLARRPTRASLEAITLEDVRGFHAAHYTTRRVALAISGQISRPATVARLKAALAGMPVTRQAAAVPVLPPPAGAPGRTVRTVDRPSAQAHVLLGYTGIAAPPEDHAALELMHYILAGGGFASRMMDELRTRRGLTAALYGEVRPTRFGQGLYLWRFDGNPDTIAEAIRTALAEIARMRDHGLTQAELDNARTAYLEGHIPHAYDTAHGRAERLAQQELLGLYEYVSEQYLNYYAGDARQMEALRRLTLDQVNAAAKKYLTPERAVIAVAGPLDRVGELGPLTHEAHEGHENY